ncbi:hypothetical protein FUMI01_02030 [Flavobacterium sp. UMI-01]|nr:hypothetical protein FUMI01_02030 [Flavobacterium sp. UMI-01]
MSTNAKASILTCGTGNESYSLFGHTAIRISDPDNQLDVVYNYGAFDFNTPNFVAKFAKGDLQYFAITHSFNNFMSQYHYEQRDVFEQELAISLILKQKLFDNLNQSLTSGDSYYTYKFIDKNCTSMVVDIVNKTLGKNAITKKTDKDLTYRSILYPYFDHHFFEKLGTSIIFGTKVDALGDHIFLPLELMHNLKLATYNQRPLAPGEPKVLLDFQETPAFSWWNNGYFYGILLGLIVLLNHPILNQIYFLMLGLIGGLFTFLGFYSGHLELANNYNILLFNPLLLVLAFFFCSKVKRQWIYRLAIVQLVLLGVYSVIVSTKIHFFIVLPILLTTTYLVIKLALQHKKRLTSVL